MDKAQVPKSPSTTTGKQNTQGTKTRALKNKPQLDHVTNSSPFHTRTANNLTPGQLIHLQRTLGNQAVGRIIQAKLSISEPDDPYEREADQVADKVMRMPDPVTSGEEETQVQTKPLSGQITPLVHRKPEKVDDEEQAPVQAKHEEGAEHDEEAVVATKSLIQRMAGAETREDEETVAPKLASGADVPIQRQSNEEVEPLQTKFAMGSSPQQEPEEEHQEIDPSGAVVQRQIEQNEAIQAKALPTRLPQVARISPISVGSAHRAIQRLCTECAEEKHQEEGKPEMAQRKQARYQLHDDSDEEEQRIQPKGVGTPTPQVTHSVAANIHALNHGGSPLPKATRAFFEPRFGVDLSGVRVHTGSQAAETAKSINARAFTVGNNIAFGGGQYAPESYEGRQLLAHELTHTVQQSGKVQRQSTSNLILFNRNHTKVQRASHEISSQEGGVNNKNVIIPKIYKFDAEKISGNQEGLNLVEQVQTKQQISLQSNKEVPPNIQMKSAACEANEIIQPKVIAENITPMNNKVVQKFGLDDVKNAASAGAKWVGGKAKQVVSMGKDAFAALVARVSPGLAELIRQGPLGLLAEKIKEGIKGWLSGLVGNINISNVIAGLKSSFTGAFETVKGILKGDPASCKNFANAIKALQDLGHAFMKNPVVKEIQAVFSKVSGIFSKVINLVIAPAFDALMNVAGGVFNAVKALATTIWSWAAPVRNALGAAWDWVKQQLGIGGEGEGGILGWLKTKASEAWAKIKTILAPVMGPLKAVGGAILAFSPVGAIYLIVKYVPKLVKAAEWLWAHKDDKDIVKKAHKEMGGTILPDLLSAVQGFGQTMQSVVKSLVSQATKISEAVLGLLGSITGVPLLSMARSLVQTVMDGIKHFITWCQEILQAAAKAIQDGFSKIFAKIKPYIGVLTSLALAIINPAMIPVILAGWAWQALDDCYKAPIINFLLDIVIGLLQSAPNLVILGPLWPIVKAAVIGFLQGVRGQEDKKKVAITNRLALVISGGSPGFLMGFVKGLLKGIWEGVTDPFKLIYAAIDGLSSLVDWFENAAGVSLAVTPAMQKVTAQAGGAERLPPEQKAEMGTRTQQMAGELQPSVTKVTTGFMPAVQEFFGGGEGGGGITFAGLMQKLGTAWAGVQNAIQGAANQIAQKVFEFFLKPGADSEVGEGAGWVAGMFAFQAILDFFTAGTWTPVSAAGKVLQGFAKFLNFPNKMMEEAFVLLKKLGSLVLDGIKGIGRLFERAGGAIKSVLGSLGEIGQKLIQFAEELLNKIRGVASKGGEAAAEKVATEAAEKVATEAAEKAVKEVGEKATTEAGEKLTTEAAEKAAKEAEEKAAKEAGEKAAKEGGEQASKEAEEKAVKKAEEKAARKEAELPAAIAEAKAITEINDVVNTPAPILISMLTASVKPQYSWIKGFEARPKQLGHYSIHMIASNHVLSDYYTVVPSVKNNEFAEWFNSLTPEEFDKIWADPKLRQQIEARLRSPGGLHEWHLVSRADVFKQWGVSAEQIAELRTLTKDVEFINPIGRHGGKGSTTAHNELLDIIDSSPDYETFRRRLQNWANYRLPGGINDLPVGLQT